MLGSSTSDQKDQAADTGFGGGDARVSNESEAGSGCTTGESAETGTVFGRDISALLVEAREKIELSDQYLKTGEGDWETAQQNYDQVIELLTATDVSLEQLREEGLHLLAWAWMNKGNLYSLHGEESALREAEACYQRSRTFFAMIGETTNEEIYVDFGALRANQGYLLFRMEGKEKLDTVIRQYEESIHILEKLPWRENSRYRHHLIGIWYNLANILQGCGEKLDVALNCYGNALDLATDFEIGTPEQYSLIAGLWLNRGNTLSLLGNEYLTKALACYDTAIQIYQKTGLQAEGSHVLELASAWANRANLLSLEGMEFTHPQDALEAAEQALNLIRTWERENRAAAEISLKARRARCQAYGLLLPIAGELSEENYFQASDEVEDALALIGFWENNGVKDYRPLARRLFCLGVQLYRIRQPQFLAEFVEETLTAIEDPDLYLLAQEVLRDALADKNFFCHNKL
jgi:tetratricopeptide (TPR) repeat protein